MVGGLRVHLLSGREPRACVCPCSGRVRRAREGGGMSLGGTAGLRGASPLEQLLEEINFQRTKEMRQLLKDGETILTSF